MKKNIIATHSPNEVRGLQQQKKLTGFTVNPETGYASISYIVEQLDPKGNPLPIPGEIGHINWDTKILNTAEGQIGGELPADVLAVVRQVYDLVEPLFKTYGDIKEEENNEE
ncbi:hypothetical protein E2P86_08635 [Sphingobacterium psychroaquaticum]|uniref:hypothetical protein n=1 Tax=Sphingobacterium psychroaquaticum TaxID=561061 RepID=UPI00106C1DE1|nr:hypothetical protein [Sphingobacterium psychroaquaticum]QBQ41219.1 hypothetical protein E2P86_08635 [Sphingobacterium psychroaquaticum]